MQNLLHNHIIIAILTQDVDFNKDGKARVIPKGTRISVDIAKALAYDGVDHFDVYSEEYEPIYNN